MGYYTDYALDIEFAPNQITREDFEVLGKAIENLNLDFDGFEDEFSEENYEYCSIFLYVDEVKWYNHENDLREISKQFPTLLFKLSGEGEDQGDMWRKYFKNGKMQYCPAIITFEEYDEKKLK